MSTTREIIDGLRRGESKCIKPRAADADLWIKIWYELHGLAERGILVEVEQVKAHRTKKEKKDISHFESFVAEDNQKADELAGLEQCWMKGLWQKQERKLCSRKERMCTQPCRMQPASTAW